MTFEEISDYLEGMEEDRRDCLERERLLMYVIAQVNSTERIEPKDVILFPWDTKDEVPEDEEDIEGLRKRVANFKKART